MAVRIVRRRDAKPIPGTQQRKLKVSLSWLPRGDGWQDRRFYSRFANGFKWRVGRLRLMIYWPVVRP